MYQISNLISNRINIQKSQRILGTSHTKAKIQGIVEKYYLQDLKYTSNIH